MIRSVQRENVERAGVAYIDVAHSGDTFRIALKRMASARRLTLRVRSATRDVVLTIPKRSTIASAREFAQRHAAWIGARLSRLPAPVPFTHGSKLPYRGVEAEIQHQPDRRGTVWIERQESFFSEKVILAVSGDAPHVSRRVFDHLKREARRDLESAVARHCATLGVATRSVTVRDTRSRWGSCSAAGALNFSWRLIMAPPFVLDYLAAHEVAHLKHMNHSAKFWALARKLAPETDRAEVWLQAHGSQLHRYGAIA